MKRAIRRHHYARLKAKRRNYYLSTQIDDAIAHARWANTPCPCSCWMCRNPRHSAGSIALRLTMQERREFQNSEWA